MTEGVGSALGDWVNGIAIGAWIMGVALSGCVGCEALGDCKAAVGGRRARVGGSGGWSAGVSEGGVGGCSG